MEKIFEIYIQTTPERLWEAITDSEIRSKYQFGLKVNPDWSAGGRFELAPDGGDPLGEGENIEVDPPANSSRPCGRSGAAKPGAGVVLPYARWVHCFPPGHALP